MLIKLIVLSTGQQSQVTISKELTFKSSPGKHEGIGQFCKKFPPVCVTALSPTDNYDEISFVLKTGILKPCFLLFHEFPEGITTLTGKRISNPSFPQESPIYHLSK